MDPLLSTTLDFDRYLIESKKQFIDHSKRESAKSSLIVTKKKVLKGEDIFLVSGRGFSTNPSCSASDRNERRLDIQNLEKESFRSHIHESNGVKRAPDVRQRSIVEGELPRVPSAYTKKNADVNEKFNLIAKTKNKYINEKISLSNNLDKFPVSSLENLPTSSSLSPLLSLTNSGVNGTTASKSSLKQERNQGISPVEEDGIVKKYLDCKELSAYYSCRQAFKCWKSAFKCTCIRNFVILRRKQTALQLWKQIVEGEAGSVTVGLCHHILSTSKIAISTWKHYTVVQRIYRQLKRRNNAARKYRKRCIMRTCFEAWKQFAKAETANK